MEVSGRSTVAARPVLYSAAWSTEVAPPPMSVLGPSARKSLNCSRSRAKGLPGSAPSAQPRLSRMLRLKSLRTSLGKCSGRAASANAAICSTARSAPDEAIGVAGLVLHSVCAWSLVTDISSPPQGVNWLGHQLLQSTALEIVAHSAHQTSNDAMNPLDDGIVHCVSA